MDDQLDLEMRRADEAPAADNRRSRRVFLGNTAKLIGGTALGAPVFMNLVACGGGGEAVTGGEAAKTLRFLTWGGPFGENFRKNFEDPFTSKTGTKVIDTTPFDYGKFEASMKAGNPEGYDLVYFADASQPLRAFEAGYIIELDYSKIPAAKDALEAARQKVFVAPHFGGYTIVYNTKAVGSNKPTGWKDFWDVKKFPGGRAFGNWVGGVFEAALLADGVPMASLYPLDVDRALKKLGELKRHIPAFYDTYAGAQSVSMLTQGEVTMLLSWAGEFLPRKQNGEPVDVVFDEGFYMVSGISIVKGSKHADEAHALLDQLFSLEAQAGFGVDQVSSPVVPAAAEKMPPELRDQVVLAHADKMLMLDGAYYAEKEQENQAKYDKWRVT